MIVNGKHIHRNICDYSSNTGHDHGAYSAKLHEASPGITEIVKNIRLMDYIIDYIPCHYVLMLRNTERA